MYERDPAAIPIARAGVKPTPILPVREPIRLSRTSDVSSQPLICQWRSASEPPRRIRRRRLLAALAYTASDVCLIGLTPTLPVFVFLGLTNRILLSLIATQKPSLGNRIKLVPDLDEPNAVVIVEYSDLNRRCFGHDQGHLQVCDVWLMFEGQQTSFSLRWSDVSDATASVDEGLVLHIPGPSGVAVVVCRTMREEDYNVLGSIRPIFESWPRQKTSTPGVPLLPPIEPSPEMWSLADRSLFSQRMTGSICLIAFLALALNAMNWTYGRESLFDCALCSAILTAMHFVESRHWSSTMKDFEKRRKLIATECMGSPD